MGATNSDPTNTAHKLKQLKKNLALSLTHQIMGPRRTKKLTHATKAVEHKPKAATNAGAVTGGSADDLVAAASAALAAQHAQLDP